MIYASCTGINNGSGVRVYYSRLITKAKKSLLSEVLREKMRAHCVRISSAQFVLLNRAPIALSAPALFGLQGSQAS